MSAVSPDAIQNSAEAAAANGIHADMLNSNARLLLAEDVVLNVSAYGLAGPPPQVNVHAVADDRCTRIGIVIRRRPATEETPS